MKKGINVARLDSFTFAIRESKKTDDSYKCVFISHKKEDSEAAVKVGNFLTQEIGVDIYLDQNDYELQEAVSADNDQKIVDSIKRGINCSTHLLCLISDKTRLSWWVPYEIANAENRKLDVASLKLKGIDDLPSFLKLHRIMSNVDEFVDYALNLPFLAAFFSESKNSIGVHEYSSLKKYID